MSTTYCGEGPREDMVRRGVVRAVVLGVGAVLLGVGATGGQAADSFKPSSISLTLAPGASWKTAQTLHLDSLPPKADIVLAVDTTGSMGAAIANARADATSIVNRVKSSIPGARFAVVDFKDYPFAPFGWPGPDPPADYPYDLVTGLTADPSVVQAALDGLSASGGGDLPESLNRVFLETASDPGLAYDANAPRFLVVLADDIGHDSTQQTTFSACPNTFWDTVDGAIPLDDPGRDGELGTGDDLHTKARLDALKVNNTNVSFVTYNPTGGTPGTPTCHTQMATYTGGLQTSHGATDSLADEIVTLVKQAAAKVDEVEFATSPASFMSWLTFTPPTPYGPFTAPRDIPYEMKVTVPAATTPGDYQFTVQALADGSPRAIQNVKIAVRAQAASSLTLTVDESSVPAAPASLPFSSFPASRIPFLGGTTSALPAGSIPAGSIPAGSIPAGSIPAGSIPAGSIPAGSIPAGSIPAGSIPAGSIPAGSIGLGNTPAGSIPAGSIALSQVLLSQIPLRGGATWDVVTAGTSLANQPLNALTFKELAADSVALARFNALQLKQIDLATSLWRGAPFAALMLGNVTLAQLNPPPGFGTWADALEANGGNSSGINTSTNTVFGVYVAGQLGSTPAGSIPAGSIPYGSIPAGSIPAGSIPAGSIELGMTRLGAVHISSLLPVAPKTLSAYVNCGGGFGCQGKTLGEADAAGAINPTLTIADLFAALPAGDGGERDAARATTLDQLIMAMLPLTNYPWEQIALEGLQDVAGTTRVLHYHVDFELSCAVATTFDVTVNLPQGFMPVLGSTRFSYAGGAAVVGGNPSGNDSGDYLFASQGTSPCGGSTATRHVRMDFSAYPGLTLGDHVSDATVTTPTQTQTVNDQAPVQVTQNHEPNDDPLTAPLIARNTLVAGHIADGADKEYFRFDFGSLPRHSKLIAYLKVPDGADFDLVVHKQFSPSLQSSPAGSIPAGSIPVEDQGVSVDNERLPLPPETLADIPAGSIPAGSIPAGSIPAGSISANRGSASEAAQVVKRDEPGEAIISVSGFNASHSDKNYVLRLQVVDPPPLPPCPAVTGLASAVPGTAPSSVPSDATTLYLVNRQRMLGLYPASSYPETVDNLLGAGSPLREVAGAAVPASDEPGKGIVLPVDSDPAVRTAYVAWDQKPCSVDAANNVVRKINDLIKGYRQAHPSLKYIVVLGTDQVIPMYRQDDLTSLSPELDEANDLAFTTNNLTAGNALYASAAQNTVLTDGAYGAFTRLTWLDHDLPLPQVPVSRLVETPEQIGDQFEQYLASGGELDPDSKLTAGYDFLTDGANDIHSALARQFPTIPSDPFDGLISNTWQRGDLLDYYFDKSSGVPDIVSPNAHYSHWLAQPAAPNPITDVVNQMVNTGSVPADLAGKLVFVMGCHSGLNVPNLLSSDATRRKDWVESYLASKTAVYIAQTGFGYGDTETSALTERLLTLFAQKLNSGNTTIGEQWIEALHSYYLTAGAYDVFDEKVMIEATFYGLPFYRFGPTVAPVTPPGPPPLPPPVNDGSVQVRNITMAPTLTSHTRTSDGRKWWDVDGQTLNVPYRPVQPTASRDVSVPGETARGVFIKSLTTHDEANVKPLRAYPVIDLKAHEPDPDVENIFFPANFATLLRTGDRASASVVFGQFRPNSVGNPNLGTERLVDSIGLDISYISSSATDTTPPQISQVGGVIHDGGTTFFVRAGDQTGTVEKVAILYNTGTPVWQYVELDHDVGDLWKVFVPGLDDPGVQILAEARNSTGLTGFGANKAQNYISAVDATNPSIQIDVPRDGALFTLNQQVTPKFTCSDGGVLASCIGTPLTADGRLNTSAVGQYEFTVTATDLSDNTTTKTVRYSVGFFFGFRPPIDNQPTLNTGKAGTTIPVKFALQDAAGTYVSDLNTVTSITSERFTCPSGTPTDAIEETTTASLASLKYDAANNQFVYTWTTEKSWAGTCRRLYLALLDGSVHAADFRFK
jgi:hypothetical protein